IPNFDNVVAGSEADLISRRILGDRADSHRLITHDGKPGGRLVAMLHQIEARWRRQWKWNFRAVLARCPVAVTAAVQQAADPPQAKSDGRRWGDDVGHLPGRQVVLAKDEVIGADVDEQSADCRAVEDQSSLPDVEKFGEWSVILDHECDPGADDTAQENPQRQILDMLLGDPLLLRPPARQPGADDERHT